MDNKKELAVGQTDTQDSAAPDIQEGRLPNGKIVQLSELTERGACKSSRKMEQKLKETLEAKNESTGYWRTVIIRCAIMAALRFGIRNKKHVMQYMRTRYTECGFQNYQQKQAQLFEDHWRIMRYLKDENRKVTFLKKRMVNLQGIMVEARPEAAVITDSSTIELINYRIGKPDITNSSRKRQMQRDLQLYALIMYARELGYTDITASIYFLRKSSDVSSLGGCDPFFFGSGGNVVQFHDTYDPASPLPNEIDKQVEECVKLYKEGIEEENLCSGTCDYCKYFDICKYTLPPAELPVSDDGSRKKTAATAAVKFSEEQQEAIDFRKGVCRIIAGAGSGKTKTVVERVIRMLQSGILPKEIFMTTFTKNGAEEMLSRIESGVGHPVAGLTVLTFNAFENNILLDNWEELGFKKRPTLIDNVMLYSIIARILNENPILEWSGRHFTNFSSSTKGFGGRGALLISAAVFTAVKKARNKGEDELFAAENAVTPDEIYGTALKKLVGLYDKFEFFMKEYGLISFDDQELLTFEVLRRDPDYFNKKYAFKHAIIDEFQDSNEAQIALIKKIREMKISESVMVVGDDAQAIYGFRETTPEYIINFEKYIGEKVKDIVLDKNFRSTPQICEFGRRIMEYNVNKVDKDLKPTRADGMPVVVNGFAKTDKEYAFIAESIKSHLEHGISPEDIAVMAYSKRELRKIADVLTKAGIPSMFGAPEPMMENSRIRAILAFVRLIMKPTSMDAAICANAVLGGGLMDLEPEEIDLRIGEMLERAEEVKNAFEEERKTRLFEFMDEISFGDEVIEYFKEQLEPKTYDETIEYIREFSLYGEDVEYRRTRKYPGVLLITAHSSKGLEWPVVYVTENKFPMGSAAMEETRRLFFVSATRARDELYVSGVFNLGTKDRVKHNRLLQEAYDIKGYAYPVL